MSSSPQMALRAGGLLFAVSSFAGLSNQGTSSSEDAPAGASRFQLEMNLYDATATEARSGRATALPTLAKNTAGKQERVNSTGLAPVAVPEQEVQLRPLAIDLEIDLSCVRTKPQLTDG